MSVYGAHNRFIPLMEFIFRCGNYHYDQLFLLLIASYHILSRNVCHTQARKKFHRRPQPAFPGAFKMVEFQSIFCRRWVLFAAKWPFESGGGAAVCRAAELFQAWWHLFLHLCRGIFGSLLSQYLPRIICRLATFPCPSICTKHFCFRILVEFKGSSDFDDSPFPLYSCSFICFYF